MRQVVLFTAAVILALTTGAQAQSVAPSATATARSFDESAVETIVQSAVAEVDLCSLGVRKTDNADVRSFCRSTVKDHARTALAGLQVEQTLGARDAKLEPLPGTAAAIDTLDQYTGHAFDRELLLALIEHQENDRDHVRYAAAFATNSVAKRYEDGVLTDVEKYLELAEGALHSVSADQP